jgi:hypothetical protein
MDPRKAKEVILLLKTSLKKQYLEKKAVGRPQLPKANCQIHRS